MPHILLTGATGFVGRQIVRRLLARGHSVSVVVRTGSEDKLGDHAAHVRTILCDDLFAQDVAWWTAVCDGVDAVIHAAWSVEPGKYLDSEGNVSCVAGTMALARGAVAAGVRHVVGVGTCFEYRLPSDSLDIGAPLEPATLYAAAKVAAYHMMRTLLAKQAVDFSWCRLFYLFGEGEHPQRLVPYLRRALEAGEVAKLSAGTQLRDFLDVAQAGAMIADVVETRQTGAINICSGQAITIRQLAEQIADTYGRRDLLEFGTAAIHPSDPVAVVGICNAVRA